MSRLDRLVSLLDTGSSTFVRNAAADQLADVQKSHPEELFPLLGRVVTFLKSPKWDTRIAAARAIGLIVQNTEWQPGEELGAMTAVKIKEEEGVEIKEEEDIKLEVSENGDRIVDTSELLSFKKLDIQAVLAKGTVLLGSGGKEYEGGADSASQKQDILRKLGMQFEDDKTLLDDLDEELAAPPQKFRKTAKSRKATPPEPVKAAEEPAKSSSGNARMRALAKRKAKFGIKPAQAAVVDVAPQESPIESDKTEGKVVVEHKEQVQPSSLVAVKDSSVWPFSRLCELFMVDMFNPSWETRHGALLGIREIIKTAGGQAGMLFNATSEDNHSRNAAWLEDLACRLVCIIILDRFADYVADQVVAPVRESCAQALGALLLHLPQDAAEKTFFVLSRLVLQKDLGLEIPLWGVCHGGMLGLRYLVSVRTDLLTESPKMFAELVECVFHGLASADDDVQGISAATLTPIAGEFVSQRPQDISRFLDVIWDSLALLKDELSTAIGHVMDLLAKLCSYPQVLDVITETAAEDTTGERTFARLVPRLFPFLRHSITDVRKAVLRSLNTFLRLEDRHEWVDDRVFRLILQNILLEQNEAVSLLSQELWDALLETSNPKVAEVMLPTIWPAASDLLLTPIGTARRSYKMSLAHMINPWGGAFELAKDSASQVNIDGPIIEGDVLIVSVDIVLRNRIAAARALGRLLVLSAMHVDGPAPGAVIGCVSDLVAMLTSQMSSQRLIAVICLEEYALAAKDSGFAQAVTTRWKDEGCATASASNLTTIVESTVEPTLAGLLATIESQMLIFRDINPVLRAVRTQCQSLFSLMVSNGLPASAVPQLATTIEGDSNAGSDAFSLVIGEELAGPTFERLRAQLAPEVQVVMAQALNNGRANIEASINEARETLEARNIGIKAGAAAAYFALAPSLPTKLNPIIRSLMDSVKLEQNTQLHARSAERVASLVVALQSNGRGPAGAKIVKNLCAFLCVDVNEAPDFTVHENETTKILSLRKDEPRNEDAVSSLKRIKDMVLARTKREGALMALEGICKLYGDSLLENVEEIAQQFTGLDELPDGQPLVDHMAVIRAILPFIDKSLVRTVDIWDALERNLRSKYSVVRFVAAKCLSTVCQVLPDKGITFLVKRILPQINDATNLACRQGATEAVYHLMVTMGEKVLPYIVFFIVPAMGRMSDSDLDVRTIAATTFAAIIKLVPLEQGIPDPEDMPQELLEGRDKEREFISQMMDISKVKPFNLPVSIKAELRSYQQEGVNWLAFLNRYHLQGILCDDMGLGKTLQTICMVASDHHLRAEDFAKTQSPESRRLPSLIVCPTSLSGHWINEFKKYAPMIKTLSYTGPPHNRCHLRTCNDSSKVKKAINDADVVITSYDIARNDVETLSVLPWNYMVLDEGHIIRNATSKLSRAIKRYHSNHRLILSGTPIQNNVLELWSLFDFLMPGFLGSEKSFNERFSKPIIASRNPKASPKDQEGAALALEALHKQVLPFLLRRLKEDVLEDLPPKIIQDYYCDLNETQRKLYDNFAQEQKKTVQDDLSDNDKQGRKHVFQALIYMRKLCNHPAFVQHPKAELDKMLHSGSLSLQLSPKLLALQQLLKDCNITGDPTALDGANLPEPVPEAMGQHRALIFCQQKDMLDLVENSLLKKHMPGVTYLRLDGSVSGPNRHELVEKFNDDPSIDLLLLTTQVGGLGLNLTGADTVIFMEHDWNPMNDLQAMDRAHRIGQKRVVNVYRLITRGTLEERIMGLQEFKLSIASTVINQQNSGLNTMGTDQILELFNADLPTDGAVEEKPKEEALDATGKISKNDVTAGLQELWDEAEYAEEYNLDAFITSLKK
ncbi:TATA-binding protein-associated factor MOT1 [Wickerhamiella sorbophila]|uniref:TATA-binding protein-associated factor MOT1 n=1 Tax=Wickerhamiella sorbophila TaxID=45607 RepID=A0A2T0FPA0_9ASCO|nr:TATA-binding protein-associated factor MOT1 [Wickerhamiella sorbophila]PRT56812.1 TATA-binding protein-associated factor MOT1 [Wickerhamiella sorbophila]